jgi:hypothetical protein
VEVSKPDLVSEKMCEEGESKGDAEDTTYNRRGVGWAIFSKASPYVYLTT